MHDYTLGVAEHVSTYTTARVPSLEAMLHTRQLSVGVAPLYHLVEYAHSLEIPERVFLDPVVQALERLGAEFVILWVFRIRVHAECRSHLTCHTPCRSNDILSYRKEEVRPLGLTETHLGI